MVHREPEETELEGEWRRDPTSRNAFRLWDGTLWTDRVSNFGVRSLEPDEGIRSRRRAVVVPSRDGDARPARV